MLAFFSSAFRTYTRSVFNLYSTPSFLVARFYFPLGQDFHRAFLMSVFLRGATSKGDLIQVGIFMSIFIYYLMGRMYDSGSTVEDIKVDRRWIWY